jgi:hypothetical protein
MFEGLIIVHPNHEKLNRSVVSRVVNSLKHNGSKELKEYGNTHVVIDRINGKLTSYSTMWGKNYFGE